eukprot:3280153-Prymnesium_polylepis.2
MSQGLVRLLEAELPPPPNPVEDEEDTVIVGPSKIATMLVCVASKLEALVAAIKGGKEYAKGKIVWSSPMVVAADYVSGNEASRADRVAAGHGGCDPAHFSREVCMLVERGEYVERTLRDCEKLTEADADADECRFKEFRLVLSCRCGGGQEELSSLSSQFTNGNCAAAPHPAPAAAAAALPAPAAPGWHQMLISPRGLHDACRSFRACCCDCT